MRRHLGVGLLRIRPHDDLALEHRAASPSSTALNSSRLSQWPTACSTTSVVSACWRPLSKRRAADAGMDALAVAAHRTIWLRTTAPPAVKGKSLTARLRRSSPISVARCRALVAVAADLDVIDLRLVADDELERVIDLVLDAVGALVAFDQHDAAPLPTHDQRARERPRPASPGS